MIEFTVKLGHHGPKSQETLDCLYSSQNRLDLDKHKYPANTRTWHWLCRCPHVKYLWLKARGARCHPRVHTNMIRPVDNWRTFTDSSLKAYLKCRVWSRVTFHENSFVFISLNLNYYAHQREFMKSVFDSTVFYSLFFIKSLFTYAYLNNITVMVFSELTKCCSKIKWRACGFLYAPIHHRQKVINLSQPWSSLLAHKTAMPTSMTLKWVFLELLKPRHLHA